MPVGDIYDYFSSCYYTDCDSNVATMRDLMKYCYAVTKNIGSDLIYIGLGMSQPWDSNSCAYVDTMYLEKMYDSDVEAPFKNYCDFISTQTYITDFSVPSEQVNLDPIDDDQLTEIMDLVDSIRIANGDYSKRFICKEFGYGYDLSNEAIASRNLSHSAVLLSYNITYRVYYWITTEVYDNVFFLSAINQQANLLNGCRYYTPSSEINPPTYGNGEDGEVYDYIFYDTEDLTCIHQLRTDNSANPDIVFIETVEDDSSAMDGFQASIIQMNGDRWEREGLKIKAPKPRSMLNSTLQK